MTADQPSLLAGFGPFLHDPVTEQVGKRRQHHEEHDAHRLHDQFLLRTGRLDEADRERRLADKQTPEDRDGGSGEQPPEIGDDGLPGLHRRERTGGTDGQRRPLIWG